MTFYDVVDLFVASNRVIYNTPLYNNLFMNLHGVNQLGISATVEVFVKRKNKVQAEGFMTFCRGVFRTILKNGQLQVKLKPFSYTV